MSEPPLQNYMDREQQCMNTIASLQAHEKLCVDDVAQLSVQQPAFSVSVYRTFYAQSRHKTLQVLQGKVDDWCGVCASETDRCARGAAAVEQLTTFCQHLTAAVRGLTMLAATYRGDEKVLRQLAAMQTRIQRQVESTLAALSIEQPGSEENKLLQPVLVPTVTDGDAGTAAGAGVSAAG